MNRQIAVLMVCVLVAGFGLYAQDAFNSGAHGTLEFDYHLTLAPAESEPAGGGEHDDSTALAKEAQNPVAKPHQRPLPKQLQF